MHSVKASKEASSLLAMSLVRHKDSPKNRKSPKESLRKGKRIMTNVQPNPKKEVADEWRMKPLENEAPRSPPPEPISPRAASQKIDRLSEGIFIYSQFAKWLSQPGFRNTRDSEYQEILLGIRDAKKKLKKLKDCKNVDVETYLRQNWQQISNIRVNGGLTNTQKLQKCEFWQGKIRDTLKKLEFDGEPDDELKNAVNLQKAEKNSWGSRAS